MIEKPKKLSETKARAGSRTLANRNVLIISMIIVVIALIGVFAYFASG